MSRSRGKSGAFCEIFGENPDTYIATHYNIWETFVGM